MEIEDVELSFPFPPLSELEVEADTDCGVLEAASELVELPLPLP